MGMYELVLGGFTVANILLGFVSIRHSQKSRHHDPLDAEKSAAVTSSLESRSAASFQRSFFLVYGLAVAADWLQGPYLYALYKQEKRLSDPNVTLLFAIGFTAGALSASFVGPWIDKHGRRTACLGYCVVYALSCLSMLFDSFSILVAGRVCGGIGTTLLYSAFEAWMVTEYNMRDIGNHGLPLGLVFARMMTVSSVIAIVAGAAGQLLVQWSGYMVAPFIAAVGCLVIAAVLMRLLWSENYGETNSESSCAEDTSARAIIQDPTILSLGLVTILFEGSLYLFVYLWPSLLDSVRTVSARKITGTPYGLAFATFMSAMMAGSLLFGLVSGSRESLSGANTLRGVLVVAAAALLIVSYAKTELLAMFAFCLFEACVGIYYPSIGYIKGQLVPSNIRGKIYGWLRLPLNVFIIAALGLLKGKETNRSNVFAICSLLLIVAYAICDRFLVRTARSSTGAQSILAFSKVVLSPQVFV